MAGTDELYRMRLMRHLSRETHRQRSTTGRRSIEVHCHLIHSGRR